MFFKTGTLYLIPRMLPLALVGIFTIRTGIEGLGEAALVLSIWQFMLVVSDFGASQWLLTKDSLTRKEIISCLFGRAVTGSITAGIIGLLALVGVLNLSLFEFAVLGTAQVLSFGQMAFTWELQRKRTARAAIYALLEFVLPALAAFAFASPLASLVTVIATKTLVALVLTATTLSSTPVVAKPEGLPPGAFGVHTSAWALTSVASGTGELLLLATLESSALLGVYRLFQTLASLGSIVGFAALAPMMSRRGANGTSVRARMLILGVVAAMLVIGGNVIGLIIIANVGADYGWVVFVCLLLGASAVLGTISIVPLSDIARQFGSKYTFRVGLISSAVYWSGIVLLWWLDIPLLAPVPVFLAGVIGLGGNLYILRRKIRT